MKISNNLKWATRPVKQPQPESSIYPYVKITIHFMKKTVPNRTQTEPSNQLRTSFANMVSAKMIKGDKSATAALATGLIFHGGRLATPRIYSIEKFFKTRDQRIRAIPVAIPSPKSVGLPHDQLRVGVVLTHLVGPCSSFKAYY